MIGAMHMFLGAAAAVAAVTVAGAESAGSSKDETLVCKREPVIGSRLETRKLCMTRAQWRSAAKGTREQHERLVRERTTGLNPEPR